MIDPNQLGSIFLHHYRNLSEKKVSGTFNSVSKRRPYGDDNRINVMVMNRKRCQEPFIQSQNRKKVSGKKVSGTFNSVSKSRPYGDDNRINAMVKKFEKNGKWGQPPFMLLVVAILHFEKPLYELKKGIDSSKKILYLIVGVSWLTAIVQIVALIMSRK